MDSETQTSTLLVAIIAGLVATAGMTGFLFAFKKLGVISVDFLKAIGSRITGTLQNALPMGLLLHGVAGLFFAFVYIKLLLFFNATAGMSPVRIAMVIGLIHGWVLSFVMVVLLAEHSPFQRYRDAGLVLAGSYLASHVVYGALIGAVVALMW